LVYATVSFADIPRGRSDLIPPVGEPVPVGEAVPLGETVSADEAGQAGEAVPVDEAVPSGEAVQVGEAVPMGDEMVGEGVGVVSVAEGVGVVSVAEGVGVVLVAEGVGVVSVAEGVAGGAVGEGVVSPWIDGGDDCPTTAATSLGPGFWGRSADCSLNTADLCEYSLRGTCEITSAEMKRAMFWGECLGRSGWSRARRAVMAVAIAPTVRMIGIGRFHHGIGGALVG
jgi:hypothetical protein